MISHLKVEKVLLSDLKFDGNNARKHDKKNLKAIKDSLDKFTQVEPLVVQKSTMKVIGGNGRLAAMKELGWKDCDVSIIDIDDERAKALGIVLNRSAELAEWEEQTLKESLAELEADGWDLEGLGWDSDDLKDILPSECSEGLTDEDAVPEVEQNVFNVKLGDIWQLGNHRLMCGDSTDKATVDKLMNGEKADMVFTDPPYGIDLDTKTNAAAKDIKKCSSAAFFKRTRPGAFSNLKDKNYKNIAYDNEKFDTETLSTIIDEADNCIIFGINYFPELIQKNWPGSCQVWDKRDAGKLSEMHGSHFELFWTKNKAQQKVYRYTWCGAFGMGNNYNESRVHPTQKPMKLLEQIFEDFKFNICIDPFLGSGSTLIACEKTGRKCYGMELDPHYCSAIIKRWQDFTGKQAVKL